MVIRPRTRLLLPLLALSMTFAMATAVQAQQRDYQNQVQRQRRYNHESDNTYGTMQVDLGTRQRWVGIRGTRIQEIREGQRPNYDMFRYRGAYYVHNNDRWYMSRRGYGQFAMIDDRSVPNEFYRIPRDHWNNYPSGWDNMNRNRRYGNNGRMHSGDQNDRSMDGRGHN